MLQLRRNAISRRVNYMQKDLNEKKNGWERVK